MPELRLFKPYPPDDENSDDDEPYKRSGDLSAALSAVVGEGHIDLLRDIASERVALADVAKAIGRHPGSVGRRYKKYVAGLRLPVAAERIRRAFRSGGGFTLDPRTGHFVERDAWAVSHAETGATYPDEPAAGQIERFLRERRHAWENESLYFGGWRDDDANGLSY